MKRIIIPILLLALGLAGCGVSETNNETTNESDPKPRALPPVTQLVIGTFKLEGTANAVNAEQAAELLPLWQVYASMLESDTAAQAEIEALIEQIGDTMTDPQNQAIEDMNLTQQDLVAVMQEQGLEMTGPGGQVVSAEQIATAQALRQSGAGEPGMPGGMPPEGGMGPGGGMPGEGVPGAGVQASGTQTAGGQAGAGMNRVSAELLNALIELLKERAGS